MTDWSDAQKAELARLWGEGHSTTEIGRRMNISKNAVVGKAHRLNLPARPSPIRRGAEGERKVSKPKREKPVVPNLKIEMPDYPLPPPAPLPAKISQKSIPCCFPFGNPGTSAFRFCDVRSVPGRPYCEAHCDIAYVRPHDRREGVA
jgi:GcrA cell cycle regulator